MPKSEMETMSQNIIDSLEFAPDLIEVLEKRLEKQQIELDKYREKYKDGIIRMTDVNMILKQWQACLNTNAEIKKISTERLHAKAYKQIHELFMALVLRREQDDRNHK